MKETEGHEAKAYSIPVWDCPVCGDVHEETGQEDIVGENMTCGTCGVEVKIIAP